MNKTILFTGMFILLTSSVTFANWIGDVFNQDAKRFEKYYKEYKAEYKDSKLEIYLNSYIGTVVSVDTTSEKYPFIELRLRNGSKLTFSIVKETVIEGAKSLKDIDSGKDVLVWTLTMWHGTQVDGGGNTYARKIEVCGPTATDCE